MIHDEPEHAEDDQRRRVGGDVEVGRQLADDLCINQILGARLHIRWIMASTPSTRHLLDGVEVPVPHRSTEPARPSTRTTG